MMATPINPVAPIGPIAMPTEQDIRELLAKAERMLERIRRKIQEVVDALNRTLNSIPGRLIPELVVEAIKAGMRTAHELFDKLVRKMAEFFAAPGWPPLLFAVGDHWLTDVADPALATEEDIDTGHMKVDNYWEGSAANSYKDALETQQAAYADMVGLARAVKGLLHIAAWGIMKFWVAVVIALVAGAAGVVGAVGLAGSLYGAPLAPADVIATILGMFGALAGGAWSVTVELQSIKQAASDLREERKYNPSFDGDKWPRATAEGSWKAD